MSEDLYALLTHIEAECKDGNLDLSDDQMDRLERLQAMFAPYEGDAPKDWAKRKPQMLTCGNCEHVWEGPYSPVELDRFATASMRLCACPRCYNTKSILMGGVKEGRRAFALETKVDEKPGHLVSVEDSGCAKIIEVSDEREEGPFVRLQSWSEQKPPQHPELDALLGKNIRVTVEVLD